MTNAEPTYRAISQEAFLAIAAGDRKFEGLLLSADLVLDQLDLTESRFERCLFRSIDSYVRCESGVWQRFGRGVPGSVCLESLARRLGGKLHQRGRELDRGFQRQFRSERRHLRQRVRVFAG